MKYNMAVSNVMTKSPVVVMPNTGIDSIHNIFEEYDFHHLPVVDQGKVVGMISKSDYMKVRHLLTYSWVGVAGINAMYKNVCALDIMSTPVLFIEPSDTIGLAADIFLANTVHALPVVDDGEFVGIVTAHDLLSYAYGSIEN